MQININPMQMYQELELVYQECAKYRECVGCPCADGQVFQVGQSQIFCENINKNKKDT